MVIQVSEAMGTQMRNAGARSALAALAAEKLDSMEAMPFDSIVADTVADTLTVEGRAFRRQVAVTPVTPLLFQVDVSLTPVTGTGPTYDATLYKAGRW